MNQAKALMMRYLPMMVTCEEADRFIDDYLAGALPRKQHLVFEWHIRLCSGCRDYLDGYRKSIDLCREDFYGAVKDGTEEIPEQIVQGIIAARRSTPD
jgi:predicted anti-sigma-YlaC factor YlaD